MRPSFPIPGANLIADTRNYAWHRPPDIVDYDEAVNYLINRIDEPLETQMVLAMLDIEAQISTIVSTILLQAISRGKIPVDLALLVAGPLARYIEITAKVTGKQYEMGIRDKDEIQITPTLLKEALGIIDQEELEQEAPQEVTPPSQEPTGGLMGMPDQMVAPQDEQMAMLGGMVEEEVEPEDELS